jgi:hypothetical protein
MILQPTNQETLALAMSLDNGIKEAEKNNFEPLEIAAETLDRYIQSIMRFLSNEEDMILVHPVSKIHSLSHTQFWVLCYVGVQNIFKENKGQLNYTLLSALETVKNDNTNLIFPNTLNLVDFTNIVFQTEYDIVLSMNALESIMFHFKNLELEKIAENEKEKLEEENRI